MPTPADARGFVLSRSRSALANASLTLQAASDRLTTLIEDPPRPDYLALGFADVAAQRLSERAEAATRRVEHLPTGAAAGYTRAQSTARTRLLKSQEDAVAALSKVQEDALAGLATLRERVQARRPEASQLGRMNPAAARAAARQTAEGYVGRAKTAYSDLSARGEIRAAELRQDERLGKVFTELDNAAFSLQSRVRPLLEGLATRVEAVAPRESAPVTKANAPAGAAPKPVKKVAAPRARATTKSPDKADKSPAKAGAAAKAATKRVAKKSGSD